MKDQELMRSLYKNIKGQVIYTLSMRLINLLLIAIMLTPFALLIVGTVETLKTSILLSMMGATVWVGFHYHKDDYAELDELYIDLKTIKKLIKLEKEFKLWKI